MFDLRKALAHACPDVRAFYKLLTTMPCILHGEMRLALFILNKTMIEGYSNCIKGTLHRNIGSNGTARFEKYIKEFKEIVNTKILGKVLFTCTNLTCFLLLLYLGDDLSPAQ